LNAAPEGILKETVLSGVEDPGYGIYPCAIGANL
jgi:hypothetical protein